MAMGSTKDIDWGSPEGAPTSPTLSPNVGSQSRLQAGTRKPRGRQSRVAARICADIGDTSGRE
eukprot:3049291-Amphidinium_carterae.1